MRSKILYYIFIFFSILAFKTQAQDSISERSIIKPVIIGKDTIIINSDSLRSALNKLNIGFINNINIASFQLEYSVLKNEIAKIEDLKSNLHKDSIAKINIELQNIISKFQGLKNSIERYEISLTKSKSNIEQVTKSHFVDGGNYPVLNTILDKNSRTVSSKLDSIKILKADIEKSVSIAEQTIFIQHNLLSKDSLKTRKMNSLWQSERGDLSKETIFNNIKNNYKYGNSIERYLLDIDWGSRILLLLLTITYTYGIFKTKYDLTKSKSEHFNKKQLFVILAKAIIFYFTLLPLVNFFTPTFIIQGSQLIIIGLYTALLIGELTVSQRKILGAIIAFYILDIIVNMIASDDLFLRIVCILFNLIALSVVSYSKRKITNKDSAGYINTFIYIVFAILNITAIVLNIIGEVDHSRSFSIACAVGLVQSFTLQFFVDMIKRDLQTRFQRDRISKGFLLRFNQQRTMKLVIQLLNLACVLIAIFVLANNLQMMDLLVGLADEVLGKVRKIGNISFTLGNLIVAIILIIITNWLQKNISIILLGGENGKLSQKYNQKMTLFPLVRLVIILVGFFIAISALGMSLDKLTVVIGALSVGIGLGMQNIINNFVSGIILVFDKPFRVGDQIELADKKGRVKEIGIRASILQTADGADVIIPNGDLLSGRVVNWTLSHDYSKTSFTILVDKQVDIEKATEWIKEAAESSAYFLPNLGISVSVQDVSDDMVYLSVVAWVNYASNAGSFKSDVFLNLYKKFEAENLKFYSVAPTKIIQ